MPRSVHAYAVSWIERIRDRAPVAYQPRPADGSVASIRADFYKPEPILDAIAETMLAPGLVTAMRKTRPKHLDFGNWVFTEGVAFYQWQTDCDALADLFHLDKERFMDRCLAPEAEEVEGD